MAGSATPTGSIFNNTPSNTSANNSGNDANNQNGNNAPQETNDSMEDLVSRLTSGVVIDNNQNSQDDIPAGGSQQQQQNEQQSDNASTDKRNPVVTNLLQEYRGQSITQGVDMDAIAERMQNGDLGGIVEAMGTTAEAAVERALSSFLTLIPEVIAQTEQRVLAKVGDINSSDKVWDQFLAQYPDYEKHKGTVREHLQKAIDSGADVETAFAAVDTIFGNLKKPVKKQASSFTAESGSEAFSLLEYNGPE